MQVNVITMLLGDIGREAGGMSHATDDKWPCVKWFLQRCSAWGSHRAAV